MLPHGVPRTFLVFRGEQERIERIYAVPGGYYLLDRYGQVYAAGAAKSEEFEAAVGFDFVRGAILK